jgi:hypothetical protein
MRIRGGGGVEGIIKRADSYVWKKMGQYIEDGKTGRREDGKTGRREDGETGRRKTGRREDGKGSGRVGLEGGRGEGCGTFYTEISIWFQFA